MREFEIWSEGYRATGEEGFATLDGKFEAETFDEAVEKYLIHKENTDWKDIRKHYEYRPDNERSKHFIWACALFDNETDARKSFG